MDSTLKLFIRIDGVGGVKVKGVGGARVKGVGGTLKGEGGGPPTMRVEASDAAWQKNHKMW